MTRIIMPDQLQVGELNIADIEIDIRSRDDIPKILRGLQYIYKDDELREKIFTLLNDSISSRLNLSRGRRGMNLWTLLVMGVLRLDLNCDYDRLHDLVNHHRKVREMLGHSSFDDAVVYSLQSIKDNVGLLTPELLESINQVIVDAGHALLKKKDTPLRLRCDSFVVETNVHYPTDITLLFDAVRKGIQLARRLSDRHGLTGWRQSQYQVRQLKSLMRVAQKKKRVSGRTDKQKANAAEAVIAAHQALVDASTQHLDRVAQTLEAVEQSKSIDNASLALIADIQSFVAHANRQIGQVVRRVCLGEKIAHEEKVFSIFESHTEWISKGKAGVPVELGVRVAILEDQYQFILHHRVMEKETDVDVAVPIITQTKVRFPNVLSCSFDKGFYSPSNIAALNEQLDAVAMKTKGKPSAKRRAIEQSESFKQGRHKHSAVESAINALEVHGLDVCNDKGIHGFKRYVALAVLTRNIHRIGDILHKKEQKRLARAEKRCRDGTRFAA